MAVGWSSDVIPIAKRSSNVAVIVPKSGASLWADLWVCLLSSHLHLTFNFLIEFMILRGHNLGTNRKFVETKWVLSSFPYDSIVHWLSNLYFSEHLTF